jgi:hypothetical protein
VETAFSAGAIIHLIKLIVISLLPPGCAEYRSGFEEDKPDIKIIEYQAKRDRILLGILPGNGLLSDLERVY